MAYYHEETGSRMILRERWYWSTIFLPVLTGWLLFIILGDLAGTIPQNLFMSITMAFASFVAGATCVGGGAVAFPVMTLALSIPPEVARNFSLLIQSVGMSAASLVIIKKRVAVEWIAVSFASVGGFVGMGVGACVVAPSMTGIQTKLFFASVWMGLGMVLWRLQKTGRPVNKCLSTHNTLDAVILICIGFVGGVVSGITGSGIDAFVFSLLVLKYRISEKTAIPTSVIIMAAVSICGSAIHLLLIQDLGRSEISYLAACVPVVVIGAPIGAWFVARLNRSRILRFLLIILTLQYVGAVVALRPDIWQLLFSGAVMLISTSLFYSLSVKQSTDEKVSEGMFAMKTGSWDTQLTADTSRQNWPTNEGHRGINRYDEKNIDHKRSAIH